MIKIILLVFIHFLIYHIVYGNNSLQSIPECYNCKNEVVENNNTNTNTNTNNITENINEYEVTTIITESQKTKVFNVTKVLTKDRNGAQTLKKILICRHCNVYATGADGNYWSFEHDNVCILDERCKESVDKKYDILRDDNGTRICRRCRFSKEDNSTLWDYEENEKCRVIPSRCPNIKAHLPFCKSCVVNSIGHDLSLLGYEHRKPCIINEIKCDFNNKDNRFTRISREGIITYPDQGFSITFKKSYSIIYTIFFLTLLYLILIY